jgi:hypothetical protein
MIELTMTDHAVNGEMPSVMGAGMVMVMVHSSCS